MPITNTRREGSFIYLVSIALFPHESCLASRYTYLLFAISFTTGNQYGNGNYDYIGMTIHLCIAVLKKTAVFVFILTLPGNIVQIIDGMVYLQLPESK